ncbi:hypothetical protein AKJ51_03045 [candidate division MSBL1 archaeon SCGC-AAA382A20]|uniref:TsaA-like domain-containing protein n=1 Tax=candidate division MSBL1 archaeon SCGC-AAA382A20 TaxID=1698280 RepID=A0A133VJV4_9EURY|nr:hypothetical protein AKJ51_03045 [candidate division MSBL1 archaeon SCGC-AAA382A20]
MEINPIGTAYKKESSDIMKIEIRQDYAEGLEGIDSLKEIVILYWMHELGKKERKKLKVHPRGDPTRPLAGVFTLRSPLRPNPIGVTKVRLVGREENSLFVEGLDAFDESPVVDIKKA